MGWTWTDDDLTTISNAALVPDRIQFYSSLIPLRFNILQWYTPSFTYPYYYYQHVQYPGQSYWQLVNMNAPSDTYWSNGAPLCLLCTGTDLVSVGYPCSALMTDLFTNGGVAQSDFFLGNGPWSTIPTSKVNEDGWPI